jgi:Arc/MetJ family transcription regulator
MAKTLLDVDEKLLDEAGVALGARTKKETVALALQRVVDDARARRAQGLADLIAVADSGGFDFDRLEELDE